MRGLLAGAALVVFVACAHKSIVAADLDSARHPAFISRIEENAGPRCWVFRNDSSYAELLNRLDPREADRRLQVKLGRAVTRFQVSDGLRASLLAALPREAPWTRVIPADQVASTLESFLVEEVPANPPDYELLRRLGADAVLEVVVEDYGLKSVNGKAQAFAYGYGRMFFLGGAEVWRHEFRRDNLEAGLPPMDPFELAKDPEPYRDAFRGMMASIAQELSNELRPKDRVSPPPAPAPAKEDAL